MIIVRNLTRVYRMGTVEVRALQGVSFHIRRGEFVGVTGPSGSGKSTLLHLIGLLDEPTEGEITIDGVEVLGLNDREKTLFRLNRLGYVFQDYALVGELTALENVILPSMVRGMPRDEYLKIGKGLLQNVGLGERINHLQSELSGGEQQRVAIARALVNRPSILLADEPCANLDSENSRNILDLFQRLNKEFDQTIVMVSHEPWHQSYFCRIIHLKDGFIEHETACPVEPESGWEEDFDLI